MNSKTENALMARGVRSRIANALARQGHTLGQLQQLAHSELLGLGLTEIEAAAIRIGRPTIPPEVCQSVLYDAAWTCCVCQTRGVEVVIHHIVPWSECHSHDKDNLVLICLPCHGRAHTIHQLSVNLTAEKLRDARQRWYAEVRRTRIDIALGATSELHVSSMWNYFNHRRVLECAAGVGVNVEHELASRGLVESGLTDEDGLPISIRDGEGAMHHRYMYDRIGGLRMGQMPVYYFYWHLVGEILRRSPFAELTHNWSRQKIMGIASPGTVAMCKGAHTFRRNHAPELRGPGQRRTVTRKKGGIELIFSIDAWECTSSSANWDTLSGRKVVTAVSWIENVHREGRVLRLSAKALAIGVGLGPSHPTPSAPEVLAHRDGEDDEASDCDYF